LRTHYSSELKPGKNVKIAGWVDDIRALGSLVFVLVRDEKGIAQVVIKKDNSLFEKFSKLKKESCIAVEGECVENKQAKKKEIIPSKLTILSESSDVLPIDMSSKDVKTGLDKRLDERCLDLRKPENQAIFKIQSMLLYEMSSYLNKQGFLQVFTPCLMGVPSESGSEVFSVKYFDKKAFLRQDPQLHRQLTIAGGMEKIYDIGPCWRAEPSHTTRHLCEHRVIAAEMAFIDDEYDIMKVEEQMIIHALQKLKKDCATELKMFDVDFSLPKKFPVLEFPEIYGILEKMGHKVKHGEDYGTEGERLLGEFVKKKYNSDFFFVNRFPFSLKPFYVMRIDEKPEWARSTDLIYKGIEMSSGGQREHRYQKIISQAKEKNMEEKSVKWFADFFKYGVPPHGGFALGIERMTMMLLNITNIRECVLFPRDTQRLTP